MNPIRLIPLLFPLLITALSEIPGLARLVSVLLRVAPATDEEALQELARAQEWRPRRKAGYNDAAHVIKVSDAISCLQGQVNNRLHWLAVCKEVIRSLVGTPKNSMTALGDATVECLREKSLSQSTKRTYGAKTGFHRPALGHGHGRDLTSAGK